MHSLTQIVFPKVCLFLDHSYVILSSLKFVVICKLFSSYNFSHRKDDNVFFAKNVDDSGVAVRITGMIDEASSISFHGRI